MPKDDNHSANFSQLYRDTCIAVRPQGSNEPYKTVYVKSVNGANDPSSYHFVVNCIEHDPALFARNNPENGLKPSAYFYDDFEWNLTLPKMGLVNFSHSKFAFVLSKQVAQKQYSRGFGSQYLRAHPSITYAAYKTYSEMGPTVKLVVERFYEWFSMGISMGNLLMMYSEAINRKWYDPKTAINMVNGDYLSVALSLNWQIVSSRRNDRCAELYHGLFPVGYFTDSGTVFVKPFYEQEFKDLLNRNGYKLNVQTYQ